MKNEEFGFELLKSLQDLVIEQKKTNEHLTKLNKYIDYLISQSSEIGISNIAGHFANKAYSFLQGIKNVK